jgi:flagellar motility protein MotE (MotC chaperone)
MSNSLPKGRRKISSVEDENSSEEDVLSETEGENSPKRGKKKNSSSEEEEPKEEEESSEEAKISSKSSKKSTKSRKTPKSSPFYDLKPGDIDDDGYQIIRIDQTPDYTPKGYDEKKWKLVPLFKEKENRVDVWQVGFDGVNRLIMTHGMIGGKLVPASTEVDLNKSGRNMEEQALLDARQRYKDQYVAKGYRPAEEGPSEEKTPMSANIFVTHQIMETANDLMKKANAILKEIAPLEVKRKSLQRKLRKSSDDEDEMKNLEAQIQKIDKKIEKRSEKVPDDQLIEAGLTFTGGRWKKNAKWRVIDFYPVSTMPKYDGFRVLTRMKQKRRAKTSSKKSSKTKSNVLSRSRRNRYYPNLGHIEAEEEEFFPYLPEGSELDGEAYHPGWDFTKLASVVRTVKTTHKRIKQVKHFIFDIILPQGMD